MRVKAKWSKGIAEWVDPLDPNTVNLSVVFTWDLAQCWQRAVWWSHLGYQVHAGGPGLHVNTPMKRAIAEVAEIGNHYPEAVTYHHPQATFASRGCTVGCWFCIVPSMEGRDFTLIDDFPVRPILCDNNLSALPAEFQDYIVMRYQRECVPLLDAQSGFEPRTFDEEVYQRWKPINKGPWRFANDDQGDLPYVLDVLEMLKDVPASRKRVYVLIGNEPFKSCMERIQAVIDGGGEPHVQPLIKLNAMERKPWVRFDWCHICKGKDKNCQHSPQTLKDVARWANRWIWRTCSFSDYRCLTTP